MEKNRKKLKEHQKEKMTLKIFKFYQLSILFNWLLMNKTEQTSHLNSISKKNFSFFNKLYLIIICMKFSFLLLMVCLTREKVMRVFIILKYMISYKQNEYLEK